MQRPCAQDKGSRANLFPPLGRDVLPRNSAWHASKVVFGFARGRSRVYSRYGILFAFMDVPRRIARERVPTMAIDIIPYVDAHVQRRTRGSASLACGAARSYHLYGAYQLFNSKSWPRRLSADR